MGAPEPRLQGVYAGLHFEATRAAAAQKNTKNLSWVETAGGLPTSRRSQSGDKSPHSKAGEGFWGRGSRYIRYTRINIDLFEVFRVTQRVTRRYTRLHF